MAFALTNAELGQWLDHFSAKFNHPSFIEADPVSIPHQYSKLQDIEIAGFFAAIMAWGQRVTIIRKAKELMGIMEYDPYQFILHASERDLKPVGKFVHRTLQADDVLYLIESLRLFYQSHESLEDAFLLKLKPDDPDVFHALAGFHRILFDRPEVMHRTKKHISTPERNSSCKRLNMYLRWMVRKDDKGVDFGLWKKIKQHQLVIPLDVHVGNTARHLGLLSRTQNDWKSAIELTEKLKEFDKDDPVKYDFALFGASITKKLVNPYSI